LFAVPRIRSRRTRVRALLLRLVDVVRSHARYTHVSRDYETLKKFVEDTLE
jgi:hypothetical protein